MYGRRVVKAIAALVKVCKCVARKSADSVFDDFYRVCLGRCMIVKASISRGVVWCTCMEVKLWYKRKEKSQR